MKADLMPYASFCVYDFRGDCVATTQPTVAEAQSQGWMSVDVISSLFFFLLWLIDDPLVLFNPH